MATTPKPRRIRVCQCPYCGEFFKWQRQRQDDPPLQNCPHCFHVIDGSEIKTTIEHPENHPHIK